MENNCIWKPSALLDLCLHAGLEFQERGHKREWKSKESFEAKAGSTRSEQNSHTGSSHGQEVREQISPFCFHRGEEHLQTWNHLLLLQTTPGLGKRSNIKKSKGQTAAPGRAEEGMSTIPALPFPGPALPGVPRHFYSTYTEARVEDEWGCCSSSKKRGSELFPLKLAGFPPCSHPHLSFGPSPGGWVSHKIRARPCLALLCKSAH